MDCVNADTHYRSTKACSDCGISFTGGHKAYRCAFCQKKARKTMNEEWQRRYYFANRERIAGRHKAYQQFKRQFDEAFRSKERTKYLKRFRKLIENGGSHTDSEWNAIREAYGYMCVGCGETEPTIKLTRDHIIPLSKGGTDNIDNIQPLCGPCNSSKKDFV